MKQIYKKLLYTVLIWVLFSACNSYWFLGEDLGIDIYGQIDQNYGNLERKQYEYELSWQWETNINEVLKPIFEDYGISCDIQSPQDIDNMLSGENIAEIVWRCSWENENVPALLAERVTNALSYIQNTYSQRAQTKAQKTFEVERIGLYSDWNIENSPFDLVDDLIQIDSIIFSEELEYEWVARDNANEDFEQHITEEKNTEVFDDPTGDIFWDVFEEIADALSWNPEDESGDDPDIIDYLDYHNYVCPLDDDTGLDKDTEDRIIDRIEWYWPYVNNPRYWQYPTGIEPLWGPWWGPLTWWLNLTWSYVPVRDDWPCDGFFCITIEFQSSNYGLAGGESNTIESILEKNVEHTSKPANASLTQRKQTTNNFELWSIIEDLPGMLRGFWIEVSSKPVPILDVENEREDAIEWDLYEIENLLTAYYKNQWLDYERRNDLSIFWSTEHQQKVFQTAAWMPTTYPENRINELEKFQTALRENNRIVSQSVNNEVITKDLNQFSDLFAELEIFAMAIEDFAFAFTGNLWEMKKIPTRSP